MYKLTLKKRVWIIKRYNTKIDISKIVLSQNINNRTVYKIIDKFKQYGWDTQMSFYYKTPKEVWDELKSVVVVSCCVAVSG